jgi:hypothetical protein
MSGQQFQDKIEKEYYEFVRLLNIETIENSLSADEVVNRARQKEREIRFEPNPGRRRFYGPLCNKAKADFFMDVVYDRLWSDPPLSERRKKGELKDSLRPQENQ